MRVVVDHALCEGNAVCEGLAPAVFELDADQQAQVVAATGPGGEVAEDQRSLVERAAEGCPRLAIAVSD